MIAEKTGSLIATSARFGGMFGGAPAEHVEALAGYGETIGIAFQLSDDLLDIASESAQSGKTPGTDLREGVPTLPVLYALAADDTDAAVGAAAGDPGRPARSPTTRCTPRRWRCCASRPALKRARETVRSYAEEARGAAGPAAARPGPRARWSRSATSSPTAPADRRPGSRRRRGSAGGCRRASGRRRAAWPPPRRSTSPGSQVGGERAEASGPRQPPAYTPVWVIEVAAAGACGCSRTTAKFIRPGQAQPRPKPSTTPTTSGTGPGNGEQAQPDRPDDQHRGDDARRDRAGGGRPASRRRPGPPRRPRCPGSA